MRLPQVTHRLALFVGIAGVVCAQPVAAAPGSCTIQPAALAYLPAVPGSGPSFGNIALEANVNFAIQ